MRPRPSLARIVWTDVMARLALIALVADVVIAATRPPIETAVTIGVCVVVIVLRAARWIDFFARAIAVEGTVTSVSFVSHVQVGHGVGGRLRATIAYSYSVDGKFFTGSFDDRAGRWPAGESVARPIALVVDRARPERSEPRARWGI
jgi:hypothetical protein